VTGVTGYKCDRCARGTTGELPNCVPCGECFDNWDRIIRDLQGLLKQELYCFVSVQLPYCCLNLHNQMHVSLMMTFCLYSAISPCYTSMLAALKEKQKKNSVTFALQAFVEEFKIFHQTGISNCT
jgi:hypothetical protein